MKTAEATEATTAGCCSEAAAVKAESIMPAMVPVENVQGPQFIAPEETWHQYHGDHAPRLMVQMRLPRPTRFAAALLAVQGYQY